jgi:nitroimidazol reductase NimA-like FMN-containing flavoprotein (pyridoxamine 5'-phosphate oxidase superfamily)
MSDRNPPPPQPPTPRTQVKRLPELGVYDRDTIAAVCDEALICHVGYTTEAGPRVIPTIHVRIDDMLYFHGSAASRTLRSLQDGVDVSVCITLLDGIRFARSMFEHSMNYRSVVVYGRARPVTDAAELEVVARRITDHVAQGRSADARMPNESELKQTLFLVLPLDEASAKVSTGYSEEPPEDEALPVWAGVLPLHMVPGEPVAHPNLDPALATPEYLTDYRRPRS